MPGIARAQKPQQQARATYSAPKPQAPQQKARAVYSAPKPQPAYRPAAVSPAQNNGGGGGGGGGVSDANVALGAGSSDTGVFTGAPIEPPPPVMETITIPDAMSDPAYQQQTTELARQMADFKAQQSLADNQYTGQYNQTTRRLGRGAKGWDPTIANGQYGDSMRANSNDFAGRGLYNSGELVKANGNINSDFDSRLADIDRARTDFKDTAALSARNMESNQEVVRQQALASAVASVAAKYGINLDQVPKGATSTIQRPVA